MIPPKRLRSEVADPEAKATLVRHEQYNCVITISSNSELLHQVIKSQAFVYHYFYYLLFLLLKE